MLEIKIRVTLGKQSYYQESDTGKLITAKGKEEKSIYIFT